MTPRKMRVTIRKLRERKGMSQVELAQKAKVTQSYISQIEAGMKENIGARVAVRLAKALSVPVTELLE
ncbi:MAG: helix-turn-helix domain-containing protein [Acidobacteriota bacterium]